jgi:hypothetical protein
MLTNKQKKTLLEIGSKVVCRIPTSSKHWDAGCYLVPDGEQINGHAVGWLIRKGWLEMTKCPEKKPPPHAMYYKRTKLKFSEGYDNNKGFTCWCGHHTGPSMYRRTLSEPRRKQACSGPAIRTR